MLGPLAEVAGWVTLFLPTAVCVFCAISVFPAWSRYLVPPAVRRWFGLSEHRMRTRYVLRGGGTRQVAEALFLSRGPRDRCGVMLERVPPPGVDVIQFSREGVVLRREERLRRKELDLSDDECYNCTRTGLREACGLPDDGCEWPRQVCVVRAPVERFAGEIGSVPAFWEFQGWVMRNGGWPSDDRGVWADVGDALLDPLERRPQQVQPSVRDLVPEAYPQMPASGGASVTRPPVFPLRTEGCGCWAEEPLGSGMGYYYHPRNFVVDGQRAGAAAAASANATNTANATNATNAAPANEGFMRPIAPRWASRRTREPPSLFSAGTESYDRSDLDSYYEDDGGGGGGESAGVPTAVPSAAPSAGAATSPLLALVLLLGSLLHVMFGTALAHSTLAPWLPSMPDLLAPVAPFQAAVEILQTVLVFPRWFDLDGCDRETVVLHCVVVGLACSMFWYSYARGVLRGLCAAIRLPDPTPGDPCYGSSGPAAVRKATAAALSGASVSPGTQRRLWASRALAFAAITLFQLLFSSFGVVLARRSDASCTEQGAAPLMNPGLAFLRLIATTGALATMMLLLLRDQVSPVERFLGMPPNVLPFVKCLMLPCAAPVVAIVVVAGQFLTFPAVLLPLLVGHPSLFFYVRFRRYNREWAVDHDPDDWLVDFGQLAALWALVPAVGFVASQWCLVIAAFPPVRSISHRSHALDGNKVEYSVFSDVPLPGTSASAHSSVSFRRRNFLCSAVVLGLQIAAISSAGVIVRYCALGSAVALEIVRAALNLRA